MGSCFVAPRCEGRAPRAGRRASAAFPGRPHRSWTSFSSSRQVQRRTRARRSLLVVGRPLTLTKGHTEIGCGAQKTEKVEAEELRGVVEHTVHRREVMATKKGPEVRRVLGSSNFEQDGVDVSLDPAGSVSTLLPISSLTLEGPHKGLRQILAPVALSGMDTLGVTHPASTR